MTAKYLSAAEFQSKGVLASVRPATVANVPGGGVDGVGMRRGGNDRGGERWPDAETIDLVARVNRSLYVDAINNPIFFDATRTSKTAAEAMTAAAADVGSSCGPTDAVRRRRRQDSGSDRSSSTTTTGDGGGGDEGRSPTKVPSPWELLERQIRSISDVDQVAHFRYKRFATGKASQPFKSVLQELHAGAASATAAAPSSAAMAAADGDDSDDGRVGRTDWRQYVDGYRRSSSSSLLSAAVDCCLSGSNQDPASGFTHTCVVRAQRATDGHPSTYAASAADGEVDDEVDDAGYNTYTGGGRRNKPTSALKSADARRALYERYLEHPSDSWADGLTQNGRELLGRVQSRRKRRTRSRGLPFPFSRVQTAPTLGASPAARSGRVAPAAGANRQRSTLAERSGTAAVSAAYRCEDRSSSSLSSQTSSS